MEANVWFAHSPSGVEEEGLRDWLFLLALEGLLLLQFADPSPKEGSPGSRPEQPAPQHLMLHTGTSRTPGTVPLPWLWLCGDSLKSEAGSRGKVLISYALCVLLSQAACQGHPIRQTAGVHDHLVTLCGGEEGESLWAQQE